MTNSTTIKIGKTKGFSGYAPELEPAVFAFQRAAYPERNAALIPDRWRWMFVESARRLGVDPMVWLYLKDSAVVAHQGAIPVRLQIDGSQHTTGWFVETMALPEARGKAIGPMLVKKALDDLPINLSLGQTEAMREIQFALGWRQVAPLNSYLLMLRPKNVLAGKLRGRLLKSLAAFTIRAHGWFRRTRRAPRSESAWSIRTFDRFDRRHDELWESVAPHFSCAVVRDTSFLNWKFVDQPGQQFTRIETLRNDRVAGAAVVTLREPDDAYRYRRAWLTDLLVAPTDREAIWQTLAAVHGWCYEAGVDAIVFDVTCPRIESVVRCYGFWRREATRVLLLFTGEMDHHERQTALNGDNWLLTKADSDIDRP